MHIVFDINYQYLVKKRKVSASLLTELTGFDLKRYFINCVKLLLFILAAYFLSAVSSIHCLDLWWNILLMLNVICFILGIALQRFVIRRTKCSKLPLLESYLYCKVHKIPFKELENINYQITYDFDFINYQASSIYKNKVVMYDKIKKLFLGEDIITDFGSLYIDKEVIGEDKFAQLTEFLKEHVKSDIISS